MLAGLNPEQRRAAEAVRGPVCILAGADNEDSDDHADQHVGRTEAFPSRRDPCGHLHRQGRRRAPRAAGAARGARRHRAHLPRRRARAAAPLRPGARQRARPVDGAAAPLVRSLPGAYSTVRSPTSPRDRVGKEPPHHARALPRGLGDHEPPHPDLMHRIYVRYEGQAREGTSTSRICSSWRSAPTRRTIERWRSFASATGRSRSTSTRTSTCSSRPPRSRGSARATYLCVVGDDYQSIYAFTGASPERTSWDAVAVPERNRRPTGAKLPFDAPGAGAREPPRAQARRRRRPATRPDGPEPELVQASDEGAFVVERIRALDVPHEEIAILCRTNTVTDFEARAAAGIPHPRVVLPRPRRRGSCCASLTPRPTSAARARCGLAGGDSGLGERELVRQRDLDGS